MVGFRGELGGAAGGLTRGACGGRGVGKWARAGLGACLRSSLESAATPAPVRRARGAGWGKLKSRVEGELFVGRSASPRESRRLGGQSEVMISRTTEPWVMRATSLCLPPQLGHVSTVHSSAIFEPSTTVPRRPRWLAWCFRNGSLRHRNERRRASVARSSRSRRNVRCCEPSEPRYRRSRHVPRP